MSSLDKCHLKPHSEKPKQADLNPITKQFAKIVKAVDNFHFRKGKNLFGMFYLTHKMLYLTFGMFYQVVLGHKGKWCRLNANPQLEMKKVGMTHSNTPVCEQTFREAFKNNS